MTDTSTPPAQPVRCWAVVDNDGYVLPQSGTTSQECANSSKEMWDRETPSFAPHRVIRVEIREVCDGE